MNVIQIQELINKIGEFNPTIDLNLYYNKGEEILLSEFEKIDNLNGELDQKLVIQFREKSDKELLQKFIVLINQNGITLEEFYHKLRLKLAESKQTDNVNLKSIPFVCKLIDKKLEHLANIKKELETKIIFFDYRLNSDFDTFSNTTSKSIQELETAGRATFNLSKKESLMFLYILEEENLLKFENNAFRKSFIEQYFNFTEVRNNEFFGKSIPMSGIASEYSKFNSNDRNEVLSNSKTLISLFKKISNIIENFEFKKK